MYTHFFPRVHDMFNQRLLYIQKEILSILTQQVLLKTCRSCTEEFMRSLEALDELRFDESQTLAKSKRKTVATEANKHLDQADEVLKRIEDRIQKLKQR